MSPSADLHACVQLMRGGSKSFFAASLLLPASVRAPATALYAFCRLADDAIDLSSEKIEATRLLRVRLSDIYKGTPQDFEADRALTEVVRTYEIPQSLLEALLEGFAWDALGRRYETIDDLHAYAARVAGTVGAMMALIMRTRDAPTLARACELGVAMQLTNIARDIGEDAHAGRLYLPLSWMRDAGIDPDQWMAHPEFNSEIQGLTKRLLVEAEALYKRSDNGVENLPRRCRPAIRSARLVYSEIGNQIQRIGFDSVNQRAVVSTRSKIRLITRAFAAAISIPGSGPSKAPPLPAIQYLVDAAAHQSSKQDNRSFYDRTVWVIDLFERLAREERSARLSTD